MATRGVELEACVPADAGAIRADARRLIAAAQAGDRAARDALVLANLPLISRVIRRDLPGHISPADDLIQSGVLGLMEAIDRFDLSRGSAFSTYACKYILSRLQECERTATAIRRPIKWFHGAKERARQSAGWNRAARRAGAVRQMGAAGGDPDDGGGAFPEPTTPGHAPACEARLDAEVFLDRLTANQRAVVTLRFGLGGGPEHSPSEAGERLGVSKQAVQQAEGRALGRLRGGEIRP